VKIIMFSDVREVWAWNVSRQSSVVNRETWVGNCEWWIGNGESWVRVGI